MIIFVFGTTAELVKLRPIIDDLQVLDVEFEIFCTGQQYSELMKTPYFKNLMELNIRFHWLAKGYRKQSLIKFWHVFFWLFACLRWITANFYFERKRNKNKAVVLVHGDTMTTVVGSFIGRLLGATVAHVEAGLRSHNWRNPFPEEINRILTGRLARVHFAPDARAVENLAGSKGLIFCTHGNTISDQVFRELGSRKPKPITGSILVLLHRVELINSQKILDETLLVLLKLSRHYSRIFMVLDALAFAAIKDSKIFVELAAKPTVVISEKLNHISFLEELLRSEFVITDSGGVQEEAAALGIPCIVHRIVSERMDGLEKGGTAVLTGLNSTELLRCALSPPARKPIETQSVSPTKLILSVLEQYGYLASIH